MSEMPRDETSQGAPQGEPQPSEDELRAAYEAELKRISSAEMVIQTAVSLLNLGGRRLGLGPAGAEERDLEQVRDAIDGVRGLMPVLERRMPGELAPLRDALAQLQMAFAREAGAKAGEPQGAEPAESQEAKSGPQPPGPQPSGPAGPGSTGTVAPEPGAPQQDKPGPAEASGRLWVPGR